MLAVTALASTACGSTKVYANRPRPPDPVNLTVYINDSRVSVSPASVGAGPTVLIVANQSHDAQSLVVQPAAGGAALAHTGPINPQGTAQVTVDLRSGDYTLSTGGGTDTTAASTAPTAGPRAATLHVGPPRASSSGNLLQP
jgi:hypothetical protein